MKLLAARYRVTIEQGMVSHVAATLREFEVTGQVNFDSHVLDLLTVSVRLVNALTGGQAGGAVVAAPQGDGLIEAAADALGGDGRQRPSVSRTDATRLFELAGRMRIVFEAAHVGDTDEAAVEVNALLRDTHARPQLDRVGDSGWSVHFHAADDALVNGWSAGCASALALAIGSDLAGRLGVCAAPRCDRVFVDGSRNGGRRFCSPQCQSRVKAAAHRARQAG